MAVAPLGFEETLMKELEYIGVECASDGAAGRDSAAENSGCNSAAENSGRDSAAGIKVAGDGKVEFTAKITEAWKAVAYSRIANRMLMEIGSFKAENFGQLEKGAASVPWELYLPADCAHANGCTKENDAGTKGVALDIHVTCKHSRLYHSDAVEERVRKVIEKALSVGAAKGCAQNLYINLQDDRCTLWLDLAGEELYKRGHERFVAEAPLKETIAAAMIFEAVIASECVAITQNRTAPNGTVLPPAAIVDPMAGSGTFSLEAAYIANGLIPGKCRDFALKHQPAFKEGTWNFILKGAEPAKCAPHLITSDISERPISIIKHNVESSPLAEIAKTNPDAVTINPQLKDFFSYTIDDICAVRPSANDTARDIVILLNPPYGKRLAFDAPKLYTKIGQKLNEFKGAVVAILAPKDCTENLLKACPALDPRRNPAAKLVETSHGGFSLNAIFAKI